MSIADLLVPKSARKGEGFQTMLGERKKNKYSTRKRRVSNKNKATKGKVIKRFGKNMAWKLLK